MTMVTVPTNAFPGLKSAMGASYGIKRHVSQFCGGRRHSLHVGGAPWGVATPLTFLGLTLFFP